MKRDWGSFRKKHANNYVERNGNLMSLKSPKIAGTVSPSGSGDLKYPSLPPGRQGTSKSGSCEWHQVTASRPFPLIRVVQGPTTSFQEKLDEFLRRGRTRFQTPVKRFAVLIHYWDGSEPNYSPLSHNLKTVYRCGIPQVARWINRSAPLQEIEP